MSSQKEKIKEALELELATKQGKGGFIILKKLNILEDKIDAIKIPEVDLTEVKTKIEELKNEDLIIELEII